MIVRSLLRGRVDEVRSLDCVMWLLIRNDEAATKFLEVRLILIAARRVSPNHASVIANAARNVETSLVL